MRPTAMANWRFEYGYRRLVIRLDSSTVAIDLEGMRF